MRTIRAIFRGGNLKPLDPIDLPENTYLTVALLDSDDLSTEAIAELAQQWSVRLPERSARGHLLRVRRRGRVGMPRSPILRQGDVVLVPFPFADLTGQKMRPAVIVSGDPQGFELIVAFITSVLTNRSLRGRGSRIHTVRSGIPRYGAQGRFTSPLGQTGNAVEQLDIPASGDDRTGHTKQNRSNAACAFDLP